MVGVEVTVGAELEMVVLEEAEAEAPMEPAAAEQQQSQRNQ